MIVNVNILTNTTTVSWNTIDGSTSGADDIRAYVICRTRVSIIAWCSFEESGGQVKALFGGAEIDVVGTDIVVVAGRHG